MLYVASYNELITHASVIELSFGHFLEFEWTVQKVLLLLACIT